MSEAAKGVEGQSVGGGRDAQTSLDSGDAEFGILDVAIALTRHKRWVLGVPLLVAIIASVVTLTMPSIYTATTRILPPQQAASGNSALLNQLGGALGGLAGLAPIKSQADIYVGMLKSRTVADKIIAQFDLASAYGQGLASGTRRALESRTNIVIGKEGIISIDVDDADPKRAAALANAYPAELTNLTKVLALTEASQRRLFFEEQMAQAKEKMQSAELAARQGLERQGMAKIDEQGRAMVELTARLRAQLSVKEVQIGVMRTFAADRNPELIVAQEEVQAIRRELSRIEGTAPGSVLTSPKNVRGGGLESLDRLRDMKYYEVVYELLVKQFEVAKIDEAKDAPLIQVLDKAIEPDQRSKPKRTQLVLIATFVGFILGVAIALILELISSGMMRLEPNSKMTLLRKNLRW